MLCLSVVIVAPAAVVHAAPPGASAYVPVSPYRILDTRIGQGFPQRTSAGQANFTSDLDRCSGRFQRGRVEPHRRRTG